MVLAFDYSMGRGDGPDPIDPTHPTTHQPPRADPPKPIQPQNHHKAGLAGIMIEDQVAPKKCGHTKGKSCVSREEAFARVQADCDARDEGACVRACVVWVGGWVDGWMSDRGRDGAYFRIRTKTHTHNYTRAYAPPGLHALHAGADILIMARTDARAGLGMDEAIYRCQKFRELGADITFLEAPESVEEMERYCREVCG